MAVTDQWATKCRTGLDTDHLFQMIVPTHYEVIVPRVPAFMLRNYHIHMPIAARSAALAAPSGGLFKQFGLFSMIKYLLCFPSIIVLKHCTPVHWCLSHWLFWCRKSWLLIFLVLPLVNLLSSSKAIILRKSFYARGRFGYIMFITSSPPSVSGAWGACFMKATLHRFSINIVVDSFCKIHMMALGLLNSMVWILWQCLRYLWFETVLLCIVITFDRLCYVPACCI